MPRSPRPALLVAFALLVVGLGVLLVWRLAGETPPPPAPTAAPEAAGTDPLEWPQLMVALIRMNLDADRALTSDQGKRLEAILGEFREALGPFLEFETTARLILTPEQVLFIEDNPPTPEALTSRLGSADSAALVQAALEAVQRRAVAGMRWQASWLRAQVAYLTPEPEGGEESASVPSLRSRDLLWGLILLSEGQGPGLPAEQARKLSPFLEPLPQALPGLEAAYRRILAILDEKQRAFLDSAAATPLTDLKLKAAPPGSDPLLEEVGRIAAERAAQKSPAKRP